MAAEVLYKEAMGEKDDLAAAFSDEARARFRPLAELLLFAGEPGREVARRIPETAEHGERGEGAWADTAPLGTELLGKGPRGSPSTGGGFGRGPHGTGRRW
ncbi:hypothetical protein YIM1640_22490 [Thermus oshimai]